MPANYEAQFPLGGVDKNWANSDQPPKTSPDLNNVRPREASEDRSRGGQRPGLDKWGAGTLIGASEQPIVAIITVNTVS